MTTSFLLTENLASSPGGLGGAPLSRAIAARRFYSGLLLIVMLSLYRLSLYGVMYGVPYRRRVIALPLDSHKSHSSAFACRMVKGIVDPNGSVQEEYDSYPVELIVSSAARVVPS